jgi:spermidine synthase
MRIDFQKIDEEHTAVGTVTLVRYVAETGETGYEIRVDDHFLMASHGACGEVAMARLAHQRLRRAPRDLRVLVGGLGAGHTLRAVLALPGVSAVEVVEVSAKVVAWNRQYFAQASRAALDDPRVKVRVGDLLESLRAPSAPYHLILHDVDNGPGWLAAPANAPLYEPSGVHACHDALHPGGVLGVWSPGPNEAFRAVLQTAFADVQVCPWSTAGPASGGPSDLVYLAVRQPAQ